MPKNDFNLIKQEVVEITKQVPKISSDDAFIVWFLRAFFTDDQEQAVNALTGGSNDKGIDAILIDDEARTSYVVQGKYHKQDKPPTESYPDLVAFANIAGLLSGDIQPFKAMLNNAHSALQEQLNVARDKIVRANYRIGLLYVTTGRVTKNVQKELEEKTAKQEGVTLQIFDRASLVSLLDDYLEGAAPPVPRLRLPVLDNNHFMRYDKVTKTTSWIFSMNAKEVGKLFTIAGRRLFARNIRGYLGQTNINKNMQETLSNKPELFWYFNNGVTIICDAVTEDMTGGQRFLIVNSPQVINGQQTTRALSEHSSEGASVLVKLIWVNRETSSGQEHYSDLVSQIVSATNYQNAIRLSDLKANDSEQVRLERELRKWGVLYSRKTQTNKEVSSHLGSKYKVKIKKEELAAATAGCLLEPSVLRLGKEYLFDAGHYSKIFSGRPAFEHLVHYWLWRAIRRRFTTGEQRYSIWLCLRFLWDQIGERMRRPATASWFCERMRNAAGSQGDLHNLNAAIGEVVTAAMIYYRRNRKSDTGTLDASSFFKRSKLDNDFKEFWRSNENAKRAERFDNLVERFFAVVFDQI